MQEDEEKPLLVYCEHTLCTQNQEYHVKEARTQPDESSSAVPIKSQSEQESTGSQTDPNETQNYFLVRGRSRSHDTHSPPRPSWDVSQSPRRRALTIGNYDKGRTNAGSYINPNAQQRLTLNEIMNDRALCALFETWLNVNHCSESMQFFYAVQVFKDNHGSRPKAANGLKKVKKQFKKDVQSLYSRFMVADCPYAINISYTEVKRVKELLLSRRMLAVDPFLFDAAEKEVVHLLEFDIIPRFAKSNDYQLWLHQGFMGKAGGDPAEYTNIKLAKFFGRRRESIWEAHQNLHTAPKTL